MTKKSEPTNLQKVKRAINISKVTLKLASGNYKFLRILEDEKLVFKLVSKKYDRTFIVTKEALERRLEREVKL
jgi:hypothetical protein